MIFTTTPTVDGYTITDYIRVIAGETVTGINFFRDLGASIRSITGGRSAGYEKEAIRAREDALNELWNRAQELGADGVVGISFDYSPMGSANDMLLVTATGTAVKLTPNQA
ncbi:MAG: YbjQ family protein [Corynebacterium sp.]|nr:YbjQ family protein [Corynebacterium sp.]